VPLALDSYLVSHFEVTGCGGPHGVRDSIEDGVDDGPRPAVEEAGNEM
jgi:hypothetical protein